MSIKKALFLGFVLAFSLWFVEMISPDYYMNCLTILGVFMIAIICVYAFRYFSVLNLSSNAIQKLQSMPYVRLLSDYECLALKKMACNPTAKQVYQITGAIKVKRFPYRSAIMEFHYLNDMKVNIFCMPYVLPHLKNGDKNVFNVIVNNNELVILTVNDRFLL
ncbi:hypothetical protein RCS94_04630 [Orbaceae bacterium ac157xtp]